MEDRFVDQHYQGKDPNSSERVNRTIIRDEVTGVNYLFIRSQGHNGGAGLTPLLDSNGRPIIDLVEN